MSGRRTETTSGVQKVLVSIISVASDYVAHELRFRAEKNKGVIGRRTRRGAEEDDERAPEGSGDYHSTCFSPCRSCHLPLRSKY